jgi:hypothetical protein
MKPAGTPPMNQVQPCAYGRHDRRSVAQYRLLPLLLTAAAFAVPDGSLAQSARRLQSAPARAQARSDGVLTTVAIQSTASSAQSAVPITFGQVFARGDLPAETGLEAVVGEEHWPVQVDVKARHDDGSVRHAILSLVVPRLDAGATTEMALVRSGGDLAAHTWPTQRELMHAGFSAHVRVVVDGRTYHASPNQALWSKRGSTWLRGAVAGEWLVDVPLSDDAGVAHPHLSARFAVRWYPRQARARVDVVLENTWAYEPDPRNATYDVDVHVGGARVYEKPGLTHYAHSRWRKSFWWGSEPMLNVRHDIRYLVTSGALPRYDLAVHPSASALDALATSWSAAPKEPMAPGLANPAMPMTGGRADIAPLPQWAALYLLSMDARAKAATLATSDLAGSWPIHYRDKNTGRPVSLADYPYMTLLGRPGDTFNPRTGRSEAFPPCVPCTTEPYSYQPDSAHQPSLSYLPYLVTGDHYQLEELQFWANYNLLQANPYYRDFEKGIVKWDQIRGQAWSLRTLGQAAYITPDDDPMKAYFVERVHHNVAWYQSTYVDARPNALGVLDGSGQYVGPAIAYNTPMGPATGIAPWMDDFFTWSVGYLATGLGFADALPLARWKGAFAVGRMTDPSYCWIDAAVYALAVRPAAGLPLYTDLKQAYLATMQGTDAFGHPVPLVNSTGARYLDQPCASSAQADWRTQQDKDLGVHRIPWVAGEMTGYAAVPSGYPSNMQPALAIAVDTGVPNAASAWSLFGSRPVKPDYSQAPQWAVVPASSNLP